MCSQFYFIRFLKTFLSPYTLSGWPQASSALRPLRHPKRRRTSARFGQVRVRAVTAFIPAKWASDGWEGILDRGRNGRTGQEVSKVSDDVGS